MGINNKLFFVVVLILLIIAGIIYFFWQLYVPQNTNIILITIDALRPDHLGCYGYKRDTSPNIDKLAKEGIIFTQAISASSSTISSVPSIMTSTYPDVHGIWEFGDSLDPSIISLEKIFKDNNFYTGMISGQLYPHLTSRRNFSTEKIKLDAKANEITDWAIEWIDINKDKLFFLWLHYFDPHGPYTPPSPYKEMFLNDKIYGRSIELPLLNRKRGGFGGIPGYQAQEGMNDRNYYIAEYDGEIRFTDDQIGRLIDALNKIKLRKKTAIIITSDHGESMGEHNYYFDHGGYLYDNLIKVPLIICYNPARASHIVINQQVSLVDVLPTILDIAKIKPPHKFKFEGFNLMSWIYKKEWHRNAYVFGEYFEGHYPKFAIRGNGWKLIYNKVQGNYELYNLKEDPEEFKNLFFVRKEEASNLIRRLNCFLRRPINSSRQIKIKLNSEEKQKLKSLGYN